MLLWLPLLTPSTVTEDEGPLMHAIQTLSDMRNEVLNYLDQAGDTGTARSVIDDTIRRVHKARIAERKWNFMLWPEALTITTVVGQRLYRLHQEFFRPQFFFNTTTNRFLTQVAEETLLPSVNISDGWNQSTAGGSSNWTTAPGSAGKFVFQGISPVIAQPAVASVLTVTGEAAMTVTVYGDTEDGVASEVITVGTPGSVSFTKILEVSKGTGWTQTMTLSAGATVLLKLFVGESGRQYRQIQLLTTPTVAETISYQFYRQPNSLLTDTSVPNIPAPFNEVLVYDALLQLAGYNEKLDGTLVRLWMKEQMRIETSLLDYDAGVDAIGAGAQYVAYTD
jgi:hypothetical protein